MTVLNSKADEAHKIVRNNKYSSRSVQVIKHEKVMHTSEQDTEVLLLFTTLCGAMVFSQDMMWIVPEFLS